MVHDLRFSSDGCFLIMTSETGTGHVFKLDLGGKKSGFFSRIGEIVSTVYEYERSFASFNLKYEGAHACCALSEDNSRIFVASALGYMHTFVLEPEGGECRMESEVVLLQEDIDPQ
eukprot:EC689368.1.p2 GENE.EC689368.1~~EC689368.1.p2  ORF type:complete len:130 (-),score=43.11 EC689368.1:157-504(-)